LTAFCGARFCGDRIRIFLPYNLPETISRSQTWGRGGDAEFASSGQNQVPGNVEASRITMTAGKFSLVVLFDDNTYRHDARTQFMNRAVMDNGAWDFAADTRGYTEGVAAEVCRNRWAWRLASILVRHEVQLQSAGRGATI
jgi:hypothetical protein